MTQASALLTLQKIELQITRARKRQTEIDSLLENDAGVSAARQQSAAAARPIPALRAKVRDLELEIQTTETKAKTSEDQLYSGAVKNPKAMQDLQQEIESLKKWRDQLEDRLLEVMMALEEAEGVLSHADIMLNDAQQALADTHSELTAEHTALSAQIATLTAERDTALKAVHPQAHKAYESLKPRRAGQPVAELQGRTCSACGVEQTGVQVEAVRRGDKLIQCENCGRILA